MTTTREAALEAALKLAQSCHGKMLLTDPPKEAWKHHRVDDVIAAALATPATEPQGYVEWLEAAIKAIPNCQQCGSQDTIREMVSLAARPAPQPAREPLGDGITDDTDAIQARFDKRPAPQPAADTQVVTPQEAAQVIYDLTSANRELWDRAVDAAEDTHIAGASFNKVFGNALATIIGNATPAPSDKIAADMRVPQIIATLDAWCNSGGTISAQQARALRLLIEKDAQ